MDDEENESQEEEEPLEQELNLEYIEEDEEDEFNDAEGSQNSTENEELTQEEEENANERFRRSNRARKQPERYQNYVMLTYREVVTGTHKEKWQKAILEEKESLKENNTWETLDIKKINNQKPLHSK